MTSAFSIHREFWLISKMTENDVELYFHLVVDELFSVSEELSGHQAVSEKTDQLTTYFLKIYLSGEKVGKNERNPMFPIGFWNQCERTSEGLVRTTNAVQGWHLGVIVAGLHVILPKIIRLNAIIPNDKMSNVTYRRMSEKSNEWDNEQGHISQLLGLIISLKRLFKSNDSVTGVRCVRLSRFIISNEQFASYVIQLFILSDNGFFGQRYIIGSRIVNSKHQQTTSDVSMQLLYVCQGRLH